MSHVTHVKTRVLDREVLVRTLEALDEPYEENLTIRRGDRSFRFDIAVRRRGGSCVGFRRCKGDGPYEIVYCETNPGHHRVFQNELLQQYARNKLLLEAARRNYALALEQKCEENRIRLVLRKIA